MLYYVTCKCSLQQHNQFEFERNGFFLYVNRYRLSNLIPAIQYWLSTHNKYSILQYAKYEDPR